MILPTKHFRLAVLGAALAAAAVLPAVPARSAAGPANVKAATGPAVKKAVAAHKGKVVLMNYWATWCEPCVAEFPDIVKLYNTYKGKGLVVVSLSLDEPEDKKKVDAFITKQKASFPVFLRSGGTPEQFIEPVDKNWKGAVPSTYVIDRAGKIVTEPHFTRMSYAQLVNLVEPVLKK